MWDHSPPIHHTPSHNIDLWVLNPQDMIITLTGSLVAVVEGFGSVAIAGVVTHCLTIDGKSFFMPWGRGNTK